MRSREMMERLADVVMGVLLILDGRMDGDEVAGELAEMWIAEKEVGDADITGGQGWQETAARDRRIVFGSENPGDAKAKL